MTTLILAIIIIVAALALLSIGYFVKGKPGFKLGMCGRDPTKKKSNCDENQGPCSVCGKPENPSKEKREEEEQE